jgi:predicted phage terminase large subunit-like protein
MRNLAKTNLWYLARYIIGNDWLVERTHKPVCDHFVHKDPEKEWDKQDTVKERLLLYPRGSLKSTLNVIDTVQWILCFPDIVIIILTAADDLATDFVDELKNYFLAEKDDDTDAWIRSTLFQALFPEFLALKTKGRERGVSGEFTTPARKRYQKEPTVLALGILGNNSGKHGHVLKLDDVLSDANTETDGQLFKLTNKIAMVSNLLTSGGYLDIVGTRYGLTDAYGKKLETHGVTKTYGSIRTEDFQYLCAPAWWVKGTDYVIPDTTQINEEQLELLFPEKFPFKDLLKKYKDNKQTFDSQQLNCPTGNADIVFTREQLVERTIPVSQFPRDDYKVFIAWDLAYKVTKGRDFTVGAVGYIDKEGRIFVLDIIRGKYLQSEMVYVIAKAIKDYEPTKCGIEDNNYVRFMFTDLERACQKVGASTECIHWIPVDGRAHAKATRIGYLEQLLSEGRLFFGMSIPCLEELYGEFERFTGQGFGKDDIPDAISMLVAYIPIMASGDRTVESEGVERFRRDDWHDQVYQLGVYSKERALAGAYTEEFFNPNTGMFERGR